RRDRDPAGARREARAARSLLDAACRPRSRPARLCRGRALRRDLALLPHAVEDAAVRAALERPARAHLARVQGKEERAPRPLPEVEVLDEVAEDLFVLADVGAAVWAAVGLRVEAAPAEEVVLDELEVRVEAQRLVVDVAPPGVGADHEPRHAQ